DRLPHPVGADDVRPVRERLPVHGPDAPADDLDRAVAGRGDDCDAARHRWLPAPGARSRPRPVTGRGTTGTSWFYPTKTPPANPGKASKSSAAGGTPAGPTSFPRYAVTRLPAPLPDPTTR